jgi:hypothetical protein
LANITEGVLHKYLVGKHGAQTIDDGVSITVEHNLGFMPLVLVSKKTGNNWVPIKAADAINISHDPEFKKVTILNDSGSAVTLEYRVKA